MRRADVVRELPNRVTDRGRGAAPLHARARRAAALDRRGRAACSGEETRAVAAEVPVISGLSEDELASMRTAPRPAGARRHHAASGRCCARAAALLRQISEIDMSRRDGPVLYTVDGVEVRLGAEEWEERLGPPARACWPRCAARGEPVSAIDLRFRDQVVLKTVAR